MRRTSISAYREIEANGLLSKRRMEVYSWLFKNGPASAADAYRELVKGQSINPSSYLSRFSELRDLGVVYELEKKKVDPVTGMEVIVWDVTDRLPTKKAAPKRKTRKQLEQENEYYRAKLLSAVKVIKELRAEIGGHG